MAEGIIVANDMYVSRSVTVGTSSTDLLVDKTTTNRVVFAVTNTSTLNQVVSLGINRDAVAGEGVVLYPGQSYMESPSEGFRPTSARISAIASAAGGSVAVYERAVA